MESVKTVFNDDCWDVSSVRTSKARSSLRQDISLSACHIWLMMSPLQLSPISISVDSSGKVDKQFKYSLHPDLSIENSESFNPFKKICFRKIDTRFPAIYKVRVRNRIQPKYVPLEERLLDTRSSGVPTIISTIGPFHKS